MRFLPRLAISSLILLAGCTTQQQSCEQIDYAPYREGLREAGGVFPGARVQESGRSELLDQLAQAHSDEMARRNYQDHAGFQQRFDTIHRDLGMNAAEVCAQSWPEMTNATPAEVGQDAYKSWRASPGHWSIVSQSHDLAGYGVARSRRGIWYSTITTADTGKP